MGGAVEGSEKGECASVSERLNGIYVTDFSSFA